MTIHTVEIGFLIYPEAQMSAVLSMTDLFLIVKRIAPKAQIEVTHW